QKRLSSRMDVRHSGLWGNPLLDPQHASSSPSVHLAGVYLSLLAFGLLASLLGSLGMVYPELDDTNSHRGGGRMGCIGIYSNVFVFRLSLGSPGRLPMEALGDDPN